VTAQRRDWNVEKILVGKPEERHRVKNVGIHWMTILTFILKKYGACALDRTASGQGHVAVSCEQGNALLSCTEGQEFLDRLGTPLRGLFRTHGTRPWIGQFTTSATSSDHVSLFTLIPLHPLTF
jgi:hypothetical protein